MTFSPAHPFIQRLAELQAVASPQHRQVIDVLLQDSFYGAMWGVEEMATRTGTSVTTIVRLAKYLGFGGFSDFRNSLKEACETRQAGESEESTPQHPWAEILRKDALNAQAMLQEISDALLNRGIDLILQARTRLLLGRGAAGVVVEMFSHYLSQAGCPCLLPGSMPYSQLAANLREEDLLIAVSTLPYSRETTDTAAYVKECGVPVMVITDSHESPDAKWADLLFRVPSENQGMGQSLATFAQLAYLFGSQTAARDQASTTQRRKAAELISGSIYSGAKRSGLYR